MLFSTIPSQHSLKQTLVSAVDNEHVAHAQLFAGSEGNPQLAMAIAYVTYLFCESKKDSDSCGVCASCQKMARLVHPDVVFVFPNATNKRVTKEPTSEQFMPEFRSFVLEKPFGTINDWGLHLGTENKQLIINVNDARSIIKSLTLKAYEGSYKVVILWLPEYMRTEAANALLKILEEPSPQTLFILASNEPSKLLTTVISRCQAFYIEPYTRDELVKYLVDDHSLSPDQATNISLIAKGNLLESIKLIEESDHTFFDFFTKWMRACFARKYVEILAYMEEFAVLGREQQKNLLNYCKEMLRESLMYHLAGAELVKLPSNEMDFIVKFSPYTHEGNVPIINEHLEEAALHIERNVNARMVFTDTSFLVVQAFQISKSQLILA